MKETRNKSKQRTITVEAQPVSAAIVPQDKSKLTGKQRSLAALNANRPVAPGKGHVGVGRKSPLDIALENFLMEEVPILRNGKRASKKRIAREPRMRALVKALYIQAIQGKGKGKLMQLVFERIGGKPRQDVYSEELVARFEDPTLRRSRIKELQKQLKVRIST